VIPAQLCVLKISWDCFSAAEQSYHTGVCEGRQTAEYLYIVNRQVCRVIAGGTDDTG